MADMPLCTVCNWHPHDVSVHGPVCANGHPLTVVGRYKDGKCRACQRASQRRYDATHREENRARWRAWWARTHAPSGAPTGEITGSAHPGGRSVAGPGAAPKGTAPT